MIYNRTLLAAGLLGVLTVTAPAVAQSPAPAAPIRHLVYAFTWGTKTDVEVHTDEFHGNTVGASSSGNAMENFSTDVGDRGTITVDEMRLQPDNGMIVSISEQATNNRSEPPATCVVYGNTNVICDPSLRLNDEEMTLLRYLGTNFVDPSALDAKQHWRVADSSEATYNVTADYTISKNDGGKLTISEDRTIKDTSARPKTTNISATIVYDAPKAVPNSVDVYAIEREGSGVGQIQTMKTQTSLQLQTDNGGSESRQQESQKPPVR
jgi:hypothetical protein